MSKQMKAALYQGNEKISLQDVEVPAPEPGQVSLDVKACGLCGSDLHQYTGYWRPPTNAGGHEFAGLISEIGSGVRSFAVGDRVCAECFSHCGECRPCQSGHYNLCPNRSFSPSLGPGGFAEFATVHASSLYKIPDEMSFEEAALVEPLAVSYRAFSLTRARPDESVLVLGAGSIGLLALAAAKAAGVREVIISAKYEHQARLATELGASHVVPVAEASVQEAVREATNGEGVDTAVETVAKADSLADALALIRPRGRIVLVGGYAGPLEVPLGQIVGKEATVTGSCCYGLTGRRTDFEASIALIRSGSVPAAKLISHRFDLSQIETAFSVANDKQSGSVKVMVTQA